MEEEKKGEEGKVDRGKEDTQDSDEDSVEDLVRFGVNICSLICR